VPVDEIKSAAAKRNSSQYRAQLYNTHDDPAEMNDASSAHPEVVEELTALLNRYRNGGYSRELPPIADKPKSGAVFLPPGLDKTVLESSLADDPAAPFKVTRGTWKAHDGGLWGIQKPSDETGAVLHVPVDLTDGVVQYEINFHGANRHSLRIECGDRQHSFRCEVSRSQIGITKYPSRGEERDQTDGLARKAIGLDADCWYPVRATFQGNEVVLQVNDVVIKGSHTVIGEAKQGLNFLVFGETAGFRNLRVSQ
jgi:hypothetical protein